jgi:hypothetical protein
VRSVHNPSRVAGNWLTGHAGVAATEPLMKKGYYDNK